MKNEPATEPCRLRWPLSNRKYVPRAVSVPLGRSQRTPGVTDAAPDARNPSRSEEHTSELQSRVDLVCRLLLEKKKHIKGRAAAPALGAPEPVAEELTGED